MTINLMADFLNEHNYDIRRTGNGRWLDQKCAFDEVCFVADCIVDYLRNGGMEPFQSPGIWKSKYAVENVQSIFGKPNPLKRSTLDEYNKFFRQPMKMLAAAGVLEEVGVVRSTIQFKVKKIEVLEHIALRERNSFEFICLYIEKTLKDSGLWDAFASFLDEQTKTSLNDLKNTFANFCIRHTPIRTQTEANRIFTKILDPLACKYHKKGTIAGKLSHSNITLDKIAYNRPNWRDVRAGKDKNIARGDFEPSQKNEQLYNYRVSRAQRNLKQFNEKYNGGKSEVVDKFSVGEVATHMHHIFPKNEFQEIAGYIENIIALTGAQHLQLAHPNGNTSIIDKDYQHTCLVCKTDSIRRNIIENRGEPTIYSFEDFMFVLDTGFRTDYFSHLQENDYNSVLYGIEFNY